MTVDVEVGAPAADDVAELVRAAAAGDSIAWSRLVAAHEGLVWSVTRAFRLRDSDADDVVQNTWLRLLEHIDDLHDPARVAAWLATTARRECLRVIAQGKRVVLASDDLVHDVVDLTEPEPDAGLLARERAAATHTALATLPERSRRLMLMLSADPAPSYEEISERLGMPVGSIGPTRGRCLRKLRAVIDC